jgi:MtN3 and saliva related transmembrane protein
VSETFLGVLAAGWGVVMALSPVMQIRRMVHLRSSRDVSIGYLTIIVIGFSIWIAYGVAISNLALIVSNCVAFVVGTVTIVVALHFRSAARAHLREADSL